jgi:L,D-transpeptidase YbiS
MAMSGRRALILVCLGLLLLGALVWAIFLRGKKDGAGGPSPLAEIAALKLPEDGKAASKELTKARSELAKFKPKGPYIVIDTHANILSLRKGDSILFQGTCSTGSGGVLVDSTTSQRWVFNTPRGVFKVNSKIVEPWWRKPDWAYLEEEEEIPSKESERLDPEMLGQYAMGFGDGYFIHGTIYERLLGVSVTHGCVRLGSEDLKKLYDKVKIGTPVYIF